MNRTTVFFAMAGALALVAVVAGLRVQAPISPGTPGPGIITAAARPFIDPTVATAPSGSLTMAGKLSHPYVVPGTSDVFATLEVHALDVPGAKRSPVNLAVVIDRSGSMAGEKLLQAKRAATHLVDLLDENDRLAIVHYGNDTTRFSGVFCTAGNRDSMKRFIAGIEEQGGTNIGEGLIAGQHELATARSDFRVNRLLLLSDGQPTVGEVSPAALARIVNSIRSSGISVTSMGVGADFNEDLMQRLADIGGSSYGFISNAAAMTALFEKDLKQASTLVAHSAVVRFTLPEGIELGEVYGRDSVTANGVVQVNLPDFAAGQSEKLVVRLRASAGVAAMSTAIDVASFELQYRDLVAERNATSNVKLSAMMTPDAHLAAARRDKDAVLDATRAQAAVNYKRAALSMDQGDFAAANDAIRANGALYQQAEEVAGPGSPALKAERKQNDTFFGLTSSASSAPVTEQRLRMKSLKTQSLKGSGRSANSIYGE